MTVDFCVHGHFYQPPREDPLTDVIPVEDGAAPFRNWNERIFANCYLPNTQLRNFQKISFNIGPTLWSWMKAYHPNTCSEIVQQENSVFAIEGVSNGLAQPYNHTILPLARLEDKVTQVRWGIEDFIHTFGHSPAGLWLPETAADSETLQVLADQGIRFTILAPWQGDGIIDPFQPAIIKVGKNGITVFFYQQDLSTQVSFDPGATENADTFTQRCFEAIPSGSAGDALLMIASDGELYGHHQPFRDLFLNHLLERAALANGLSITFPGKWLKQNQTNQKVTLVEKTSWSCPHGVERWRGTCGCTPNGEWKSHLRYAMDQLGDLVNDIYFNEVSHYMDPWELRNEYIHVINDEMSLIELLGSKFSLKLDANDTDKIAILLAAQYERQRTFTSCGWFFEDFDRIEPKNNIRYAAQAVWLTKLATGIDLSNEAVNLFQTVRSWRNGSRGDMIFLDHMKKAEEMAVGIKMI